jgi:phosphatidylglycerophosphatase C
MASATGEATMRLEPSDEVSTDDHLASERPLVAFDFDGTLTVKDSFLAFLRWRAGPVRYALGLSRLTTASVAFLTNQDRGKLKERAVAEFLKGVPRADLERDARAFAAHAAPQLLRPDAVEAWRRWRAKGAHLVIVTASPEILVHPFARVLGAEWLLGTGLAFDADDRCSGLLDGENCRGEAKVARLREVFGPDVHLAAAYGDTSGDTEMLSIADEKGFKVFTAKP